MSGYNFTDRVRFSLKLAREAAADLRHPQVGPDHILFGLAKDGRGVGIAALERVGLPAATLRDELASTLAPAAEPAPSPGELPYTVAAKRVLELAMTEAHTMGQAYVGSEHLVLGIARLGQGEGAKLFTSHGLDLPQLREAVRQVIVADPDRRSTPKPLPPPPPASVLGWPASALRLLCLGVTGALALIHWTAGSPSTWSPSLSVLGLGLTLIAFVSGSAVLTRRALPIWLVIPILAYDAGLLVVRVVTP